MKKTLIALAALAATGASFAQVTITGTVASGFKDRISADGAQTRTSGFGVDKAEINFTAKEDMGGGQSIEAKFGLANVSRGSVAGTSLEPESTAFGPGDLTLTYTNTSFGRIQMGTERGAALMAGIPSAGAPVVDMDGKIYQLRSSSDFISYAAPIGPVIVAFKHSEGSNVKGLGVGMSGSAGAAAGQMGQRTNDLAVVYKQDALELVGVYRSYDNRDAASMTTGNSLTKDSAIVLQAGYDFGVAKVGFGYNNVTASASPVKLIDMMIGVSAPIGPLTVGATFGREEVTGVSSVASSYFAPSTAQLAAAGPFAAATTAAAGSALKNVLAQADGTATSFSLGAKYDLSKRTSFTVNYARWQRSGYAQFEATGSTGLQSALASATPVLVGAGVTAATPIALAQPGIAAAVGYTGGAPTLLQAQSAVGATIGTVAAVQQAYATGANSAAAQTAASNAAALAAPQMGYKSDGSEFNIVLSYSF